MILACSAGDFVQNSKGLKSKPIIGFDKDRGIVFPVPDDFNPLAFVAEAFFNRFDDTGFTRAHPTGEDIYFAKINLEFRDTHKITDLES